MAGLLISLLLSARVLNSGSFESSRRINQDLGEQNRKVTVTLKLVQVFVTDKRGKPVKDLERSDFDLYDNSRPAEIVALEKYVSDAPQIKTKIDNERTRSGEPGEANRKYFLLFDFAFNNKFGVRESKNAALHFINNWLQNGDEIAVVSYSTLKRLSIDAELTTDRQNCREIIERLEKGNLGRFAPNVEEEYWEFKNDRSFPRTPRPEISNSKRDLIGLFYGREFPINSGTCPWRIFCAGPVPFGPYIPGVSLVSAQR